MSRSRVYVLGGFAVVMILGGALWFRTRGEGAGAGYPWPETPRLVRLATPAPAANVPSPPAFEKLELPRWGGPDHDANAPIRFRTDLDVLAPLGDGPANAALWLKDFTKGLPSARLEESDRAMKRRVDGPPGLGKVFPPGEPLLLEAEPWADQATMRFYPDVFTVRGRATPLHNLLFSLTLGKSWVARALANPDAPAALEDCRRAIRWGRLLRQDDVTVIQDLIGLAVIRQGAQALYDLASRRGDTKLMLAAAIVVGEHGEQRLLTMLRLNQLRLAPAKGLGVTDERLSAIVEMARRSADRRFRFDAVLTLGAIRSEGTKAHRAKAQEALDGLAGEKDPILAPAVKWARIATFTKTELDDLVRTSD